MTLSVTEDSVESSITSRPSSGTSQFFNYLRSNTDARIAVATQMHDTFSSFPSQKDRSRRNGMARALSRSTKRLPVLVASACTIFAFSGTLLLIGSALVDSPPATRSVLAQDTNSAIETRPEYIPSPPIWKNFLDESRAVFYNLYVGRDDHKLQYALRLVNRQIQLLRSTAKWHSVPLFYTHIGNPKANFNFDSNAHLLKYTPAADESATLDELHSYCQENTNALVLYIHSKGTFHPSYANDIYRTFNMRGATSPECVNALTRDMDEDGNNNDSNTAAQFNVCGSRFSAFPHYHFPGNMFLAKCSYVQRLVRPSELPQKMKEIVQEMKINTTESDAWMYGIDRFAYEHWIGSHPGVKPCDIYPDDSYKFGYDNLPEYNVYQALVQPAPRYLDHSFMKMHAFWQLEGRLFEWKYLHPGEQPSDWVWGFYNTSAPVA